MIEGTAMVYHRILESDRIELARANERGKPKSPVYIIDMDARMIAALERLERSRAADERDGRVWLGHALLYAWWVIRHQLESSNKKVKPRHGNV